MRRMPPGCHQFHGHPVCNRCGYKTILSDFGPGCERDATLSHLADCQPELFHNHLTRDVKPYGQCPRCDATRASLATRQPCGTGWPG